ncbi:hypothetical protein WN944_025259 [Citrus x changshan-huyou]|uniref:MATH domain-containing protein n=1 Tax=Citrus x changshan-huyou TaxID=2935761 RepID=A0AAP0LQ80_9ROSI
MGRERRFGELKLQCGFDQFIPLTTFNNTSNGYLVEDTCVFDKMILAPCSSRPTFLSLSELNEPEIMAI